MTDTTTIPVVVAREDHAWDCPVPRAASDAYAARRAYADGMERDGAELQARRRREAATALAYLGSTVADCLCEEGEYQRSLRPH